MRPTWMLVEVIYLLQIQQTVWVSLELVEVCWIAYFVAWLHLTVTPPSFVKFAAQPPPTRVEGESDLRLRQSRYTLFRTNDVESDST